ncbi:MAG: chromate resistance protein [Rhodospirillaceae bacterium]|jgi:rhodanese-related sulfurtransferase|nr:chromate resistance protein [Rhodospirillaceae bacterium]
MATNTQSHSPSPGISASDLAHTLGSAEHPLVIDVRRTGAFQGSADLLCAALHRSPEAIDAWQGECVGARRIVTVCVHGHEVSQNAAALLRQRGFDARYLVGGIQGWIGEGLPTLRKTSLYNGVIATRWVTRARPKIDRIACPWLIRRFIDPRAVFHYAPADDVIAAAERLQAIPFDIPDVQFSHRGASCSFDAMIEDFAVKDPALLRLAEIIRGADTSCLDLTAQSAGLYAISLGLSDLIEDDDTLLQSGMMLYDALYRWQRDLGGETHTWPPRDLAAGATGR